MLVHENYGRHCARLLIRRNVRLIILVTTTHFLPPSPTFSHLLNDHGEIAVGRLRGFRSSSALAFGQYKRSRLKPHGVSAGFFTSEMLAAKSEGDVTT